MATRVTVSPRFRFFSLPIFWDGALYTGVVASWAYISFDMVLGSTTVRLFSSQ